MDPRKSASDLPGANNGRLGIFDVDIPLDYDVQILVRDDVSEAQKEEEEGNIGDAVKERGAGEPPTNGRPPEPRPADGGVAALPPKRSIRSYRRDELIEALLQVLGSDPQTRDDAIRAAAHHLGFRRTGADIRNAIKSAINGAIRRGKVVTAGQLIRRP